MGVRGLAALLVVAALLAGCGAATTSSEDVGYVPMHLAYSPGPIGPNAAVYVPGLDTVKWRECNDLWAYVVRRPTVAVPYVSAAKLAAFRDAGIALGRSDVSAMMGPAALNAYVNACYALFRN